jgi:uncharacterized phosphosugar-binding protein
MSAPSRAPDNLSEGDNMTTGRYLDQIVPRLERIRSQAAAIDRAAEICAETIAGDGVVHVFGAGHSRMMAEEAYPRIGAVAGFRPVVELAVTFFHDVVGPNGLAQALFLERAPGYGAVIFNELAARLGDATIVFSSSGVEAIIMDYVDAAKSAGTTVIGVTSFEYSSQTSSERGGVRRLADVADVAIDNGVPVGDAIVTIPGIDERVSASASILNLAVMNEITSGTAQRLAERGQPPIVFASPHLAGHDRSKARYEQSLAEYRRRVWGERR